LISGDEEESKDTSSQINQYNILGNLQNGVELEGWLAKSKASVDELLSSEENQVRRLLKTGVLNFSLGEMDRCSKSSVISWKTL
jgi:hypothetical protein